MIWFLAADGSPVRIAPSSEKIPVDRRSRGAVEFVTRKQRASLPHKAKKSKPQQALAEVSEVKLNRKRGFYEAPLDLSVTTKTEGAVIRSTTAGSELTLKRGMTYRAERNPEDWVRPKRGTLSGLVLIQISDAS